MWTEKERERDWGQRRGSKEATRTSNDLGFKSFCRSRWRPTPFLSRGSRNSCLSFVQGRATNLGLVTEVPIRRLLRGPGREKWDSIGGNRFPRNRRGWKTEDGVSPPVTSKNPLVASIFTHVSSRDLRNLLNVCYARTVSVRIIKSHAHQEWMQQDVPNKY